MFEILKAHGQDADRWQSYWERLPDETRDVMFTPAYARVQEMAGHGTAYAAVYTWEKYFVLQPFVLREASAVLRDIGSMYGGGGPVTNMNGWSRRALWEWFDQSFAKWRQSNGVVCEYAQLHPVAVKAAQSMLPELLRIKESVVVKLDTDDKMLVAMSNTRQQTLARGWRDGLVAKRAELPAMHIGVFSRLYDAAMARKNAADRWLLPEDYFLKYFSELGPLGAALIKVEKDGEATTMAIVVLGGRYAHFHFAASVDKPPQGSSDLVIFEAARVARESGAQFLNLGGGVTSDPKDSLLWYKAGFSPVREAVYSVKRIFDHAAYEQLCAAAKVETSEKSYFPAYRRARAA